MSEEEQSNIEKNKIDNSKVIGNAPTGEAGKIVSLQEHIAMRGSTLYTEHFIPGTGYYKEYIQEDA